MNKDAKKLIFDCISTLSKMELDINELSNQASDKLGDMDSDSDYFSSVEKRRYQLERAGGYIINARDMLKDLLEI